MKLGRQEAQRRRKAVISIQRVARGRQGRRRAHERKDTLIVRIQVGSVVGVTVGCDSGSVLVRLT